MAGSNNRITAAELIAQANVRQSNTSNALNIAGSNGIASDNSFNKQMGIKDPVDYLNQQHNVIANELMQALEQGVVTPEEVQNQLSKLNPAVAGEISNMLFAGTQTQETVPTGFTTQDDSVLDLENPQDVAMQRLQARLQEESAKVLTNIGDTANKGLTAAKQALIATVGTVEKASKIAAASQAKKLALDPEAALAQKAAAIPQEDLSYLISEPIDRNEVRPSITNPEITVINNEQQISDPVLSETTPEVVEEALPVESTEPEVIETELQPEIEAVEPTVEEANTTPEKEQSVIFDELVAKAKTQSLDEFLVEASDYTTALDAAKLYSEVQLNTSTENLAKIKEEIRLTSPRYASEVVTDSITSVAKGGVLIGEALYGLVNAATLNRLENSVGIGGALNVSREWLNDQMSDQTKYSKEKSAAQLEATIKTEMDKLDAKKVNGANSVFDYAKALGNLVAGGAFSLLDNPLALADTVLESAVAFAVPVAFASATRAKLLSAIPEAEKAAFLASKGSELEKKVELAALIGIASMEAGSTSNQLQQRILNMSEDELMQYDKYRNMVADNVDPELAKQALAADASIIAYGFTALGAGTVSKIVGSNAVAATLSKSMSKIGEGTKRTIKAGINETFEEGLQNPVSEIGSNLGNLAVGKDGQTVITPEVATSAGQGAVAGLISGTSVAGAASALSSAAKTAAKVSDLGKEAKLTKTSASLVSEQGLDRTKLTEVLNAVKDVKDPAAHISVLKGILEGVDKNKDILKDPAKLKDIEESVAQIQETISNNIFETASKTAYQKVVRQTLGLAEDSDLTKENLAEFKKAMEDETAKGEVTIQDALFEAEVEAVDNMDSNPDYQKAEKIKERTDIFFKGIADNILNKTTISEDEVSTLLRVFGSAPITSYSVQDYDKLMSTEGFKTAPKESQEQIRTAYELKKFMSDEVNQSVVNGGENEFGKWVGINNWLAGFDTANAAQNIKGMQEQRSRLVKWYKDFHQPKQEKNAEYIKKNGIKSEKQQAFFANVEKETKAMLKTIAYMNAALAKHKVDKTDLKSIRPDNAKPKQAKTEPANKTTSTESKGGTYSSEQLNELQSVLDTFDSNEKDEKGFLNNVQRVIQNGGGNQDFNILLTAAKNRQKAQQERLAKAAKKKAISTDNAEEVALPTKQKNKAKPENKKQTEELPVFGKEENTTKESKPEVPASASEAPVRKADDSLDDTDDTPPWVVEDKAELKPNEVVALVKTVGQNQNANGAKDSDLATLRTLLVSKNPTEKAKELSDLILQTNGAPLSEVITLLKNYFKETNDELGLLVLEAIENLPNVQAVGNIILGAGQNEDGSLGVGYYSAKHKISINPFFVNMDLSTEQGTNYLIKTVLHEMIHAASWDVINNNEELRNRILAVSNTIREQLLTESKEVQLEYDELLYGLNDKNGQELLAVLFASPSLFKYVNKVRYDIKKGKGTETKKNFLKSLMNQVKVIFDSLFKSLKIPAKSATYEVFSILNETISLVSETNALPIFKAVGEELPVFFSNNENTDQTNDFLDLSELAGNTNDSSLPYFAEDYGTTPDTNQQGNEAQLDQLAEIQEDNNAPTDYTYDISDELSVDGLTFLKEKLERALYATQQEDFVTAEDYFVAGKPVTSSVFVPENTLMNALFEANKTASTEDMRNAAEQAYRNMFGIAAETVLNDEQVNEVAQLAAFSNEVLGSYLRLSKVYFPAFTEAAFKDADLFNKEVMANPLSLISTLVKAKDNDGNQKRQLDNETRKHMALAMVTELMVNDTLQQTKVPIDTIKRLMGLNKDAEINFEISSELLNAGFALSDVKEALGKHVLRLLGLKFKTGMKETFISNTVENIVLAMLTAETLDNGLFDTSLVDLNENFKQMRFYKLKERVTGNSNLVSFSENDSLIEKVSGVTNLKNKPLTEEPTSKNIKANIRSRNPFTKLMKISKDVMRDLLTHSKVPNEIFQDSLNGLIKLNEAAQKIVFGVVPESIMKDAHIIVRQSNEATNETNTRELNRLKAFAKSSAGKVFYWVHDMVSNGRIMPSQTYLDPQNSKNTRHFLGAKIKNPVSIKVASPSVKLTEKEQLDFLEFQKAVLQAYDLKPDLKTAAQINKVFNDLLDSKKFPFINAAVDMLMQDSIDAGINQEQILIDALYNDSAKADGAAAGFHALVALAEYKKAKNKKGTGRTFTTSIRYEIDGKTNGTAHALISWAGAESAEELVTQLRRVGIFTEGDAKSFMDFKNGIGDTKDHYEYFASKITEAYKTLLESAEGVALDSLNAIARILNVAEGDGFSINRKLAKQPLMTLLYGAGITGVVDHFVNDLVNGLYDQVTQIRNDYLNDLHNYPENKEKLLADVKAKYAALADAIEKISIPEQLTEAEYKKKMGSANEWGYYFYKKNRDEIVRELARDLSFLKNINANTIGKANDWTLGKSLNTFSYSLSSTFVGLFTDAVDNAYGTLGRRRKVALALDTAAYDMFRRAYKTMYTERAKAAGSVNLSPSEHSKLIKDMHAKGLVPMLEGWSINNGNGLPAVKVKRGTQIEAVFYRSLESITYINAAGELVQLNESEYSSDGETLIFTGGSLNGFRELTFTMTTPDGKNVQFKLAKNTQRKFNKEDFNLKKILTEKVSYKEKDLPEEDLQVRVLAEGLAGNKQGRYSNPQDSTLIIRSPGVSLLATGVHENDGTNQRKVIGQGAEVLQVHDAYYMPLGQGFDYGQEANKAFWELHSKDKFNPLQRHLNMMNKTAKNLQSNFPDIHARVAGMLNDLSITAGNEINSLYTIRRDTLSQIRYVGQFADPNATYTVPSKEEDGVGMYQPKTMGSSNTPLNNFVPQDQFDVDQTNILRIYENINTTPDPVTVSTEHGLWLDAVMENLVHPVVQKTKLAIQNTNSETIGSYEPNDQGGMIRIQRGTQAPAFGSSRKEVLAHEFVHHISEAPIEIPSKMRERLESLYDIARDYLKPEDLIKGNSPFSTAQLDAATELYNYIFNNEQQTAVPTYSGSTGLISRNRKVNNGIHEFVAFGLTHEGVKNALNNLFTNNPQARKRFQEGEPYVRITSSPNSTLFSKSVDFINDLLNYFQFKVRALISKIDGLGGQDADKVLYILAQKMTSTESSFAASEMKINKKLMQANQFVSGVLAKGLRLTGKGIDKVYNVGAENFATLLTTVDSESAGKLLEAVFDKFDLDKDNLFRSVLVEAVGTTGKNRFIRDLLLQAREYVDRARQFVSANVQTQVARNMSQELTDEESAAFTRVVLNLDLVSAFDGDVNNLINTLSDNAARQQRIEDIENQITNLSPKAHLYIINQSKALGHYLVNAGHNHQGNGLFNATQIANLDGLNMKPDFNVQEAMVLIDELVTLYGINQSDNVDVRRTVDVMKREVAAGSATQNSIQKYLDLHSAIKRTDLERHFKGEERLSRKGYTKEQFDPFMGYRVVKESEVDAYRKDKFGVMELTKSKDDPNQEKMFIVYGEALALETHSSGVISKTSLSRKGANLFSSYTQLDSDDPANSAKAAQDMIKIKRRRQRVNEAMNKPNFRFTGTNGLSPVWNPKGNIVDYRYEMSPKNKELILNKKQRFDSVLGATAAASYDKVGTSLINTRAVAGMYSLWKETGAFTDQFIKIGPMSKSKEDRDMWYLMPNEARQQAKALFGGDFVMVRKDDYRMWFGGRKPNLTTLGDWFSKKTQNTILEQTGNALAKALSSRYPTMIYDGWKDIVSLAKERIVILNTAVLGANIMSNTLVLFMSGMVNPAKIISYQVEGYNYLRKYERDHVESTQLKIKLSDKTLTSEERKRIEGKIRILEDRLALNPVSKLVDRGAYQTIVEDVSMLDEEYGYASKLERKFEPLLSKVPDVVKDIGNTVFMTKSTSTNRMLRDAASMSDFAARYALTKFRMENGVSFEESFNEVMENFVTYEMPTNIHIQWMNDVGLAMFTKFYIRIQKVILRRFRNNPINMAAYLGIEAGLDSNYSDIVDTTFGVDNTLNRIQLPDHLIGVIAETNLISVIAK